MKHNQKRPSEAETSAADEITSMHLLRLDFPRKICISQLATVGLSTDVIDLEDTAQIKLCLWVSTTHLDSSPDRM